MRLVIKDTEKCVGCQSCMFACARRQGDGGLAETRLGVKSVGGMERGFIVVVCRACHDAPCARVCPTNALEPRNGGGVHFDPSKCIGCGHCCDACLVGAIFWNEETNKPMVCIQCGYCVKFCPHGVLAMEEREASSYVSK